MRQVLLEMKEVLKANFFIILLRSPATFIIFVGKNVFPRVFPMLPPSPLHFFFLMWHISKTEQGGILLISLG